MQECRFPGMSPREFALLHMTSAIIYVIPTNKKRTIYTIANWITACSRFLNGLSLQALVAYSSLHYPTISYSSTLPTLCYFQKYQRMCVKCM